MQFYCIWKENIHCWWDLYPIAPYTCANWSEEPFSRETRHSHTHTHTHTQSLSPPHPPLPCAFTVRINVATLLKYHQSFKVHLQCSIVHSLSNRILSLMGKLSGILFTLSCILSSWGQRLDFTSSWIRLHLAHSTLKPSMPCQKSLYKSLSVTLD